MNSADLTGAVWRKSRRSNGQSNCVEVAFINGAVALRDSKNTNGGVMVVLRGNWSALLNALK